MCLFQKPTVSEAALKVYEKFNKEQSFQNWDPT